MAHSFSTGNMAMQVCADAANCTVARPRSDPDSRKTRYCYAIRSRVTSFIWSGPHWRTRAGRSCFLIAIPSSPLKIRLARSLYKWTLSLENRRIPGQNNNVELSWVNNEENRLSLVSVNVNFKFILEKLILSSYLAILSLLLLLYCRLF